MKQMNKIMEKIDLFRFQRHLTAGEMAEIMGIGRGCYFRWLKNPALVRVDAIDRACSYLKIDARMITDDSEPVSMNMS